jgi:hypothetical protein
MASISKQGGDIVARWDRDDWLAGLMPGASSGGTDSREGNGFSSQLAINPWRTVGYIQPGFAAADVANMSDITASATIKNIAVASGSAYGIENNVKLHKLNQTTGEVIATAGWPHTIGSSLDAGEIHATGSHTTFVGSDVITYSISGTDYVFYSWNDGTDGGVGRLTPSGPTFEDDYLLASATGGAVLNKDYPHPMIVSNFNDTLYIANGPNIVAYDGPTNTAATLAFQAPNGYIITSFAETANYLVVFCSTKQTSDNEPGKSLALFWDRSGPRSTYSYDLKCSYVNGAFSFKGSVGIFGQRPTLARNRSFMMIFNGTEFDTVKSFREKIPGHGGVTVMDEMILFNAGFLDSGTSRIYSYGKLVDGFDNSLNMIGSILGVDSEGVMFATSTSTYIASAGTTSGELQSFSANYEDSANFFTGLKNIPFPSGKMGRVREVRVVYKDEVTSGRQFTLSLNSDSSGTTTEQRGTLTTIVSAETSLVGLKKRYGWRSDGTPLPMFENSLGLRMNWANGSASEAHVIHSVEVFIEIVNSEY